MILAAIGPQYEAWRAGPVQWIMTTEEQSAWGEVTTDKEATRFIDQFWARRDPTPDTPENEFRNEFELRVLQANDAFSEEGRRGSMTERGRAFITSAAMDTTASLFLLRDVDSISGERKQDPFDGLQSLGAFKTQDELGWLVRYCTGATQTPAVLLGVQLAGTSGNERLESSAPPEEMKAERIRAAPGCFLLRGSIPLSYLEAGPGDYQLEITIDSPATKKRHDVRQPFRIE